MLDEAGQLELEFGRVDVWDAAVVADEVVLVGGEFRRDETVLSGLAGWRIEDDCPPVTALRCMGTAGDGSCPELSPSGPSASSHRGRLAASGAAQRDTA